MGSAELLKRCIGLCSELTKKLLVCVCGTRVWRSSSHSLSPSCLQGTPYPSLLEGSQTPDLGNSSALVGSHRQLLDSQLRAVCDTAEEGLGKATHGHNSGLPEPPHSTVMAVPLLLGRTPGRLTVLAPECELRAVNTVRGTDCSCPTW